MRRLLLVRHAPTVASGRGEFPLDEPLLEPGRTAAARLAEMLPAGAEARCSPALRCRQTAEAAGLDAAVDGALAECDFGAWGGRTLAEIGERDAGAWFTDPLARPHGGESLA